MTKHILIAIAFLAIAAPILYANEQGLFDRIGKREVQTCAKWQRSSKFGPYECLATHTHYMSDADHLEYLATLEGMKRQRATECRAHRKNMINPPEDCLL